MGDVLKFALLGLGLGALYALASQGLMVIYRGSGVLSFAHGAVGMVGAYVHWELKEQHGLPAVVAWPVALAVCAAIGAAAHLGVMRQLQRASPLARIVATLLHELRRRGGRYGMATLCLGGGGSVAMAFERV